MKLTKEILLDCYRDATPCNHPKPRVSKTCRDCMAGIIEKEMRFYFAQELRLVIDIALDGVKDKKVIDSDYFQGWRDAIAHLDPSGQQFLDLVKDVFTGRELSN